MNPNATSLNENAALPDVLHMLSVLRALFDCVSSKLLGAQEPVYETGISLLQHCH